MEMRGKGANGLAYMPKRNAAERYRPSSKTHIRELEHRIRSLERDLKKAQKELQCRGTLSSPVEEADGTVVDPLLEDSASTVSTDHAMPDAPRSLVGRICARQSQLNTDELGQLRFFGATSSIHTANNVSSTFAHWNEFVAERDSLFDDDIPLRLQEHLLEQYWK